VWPGSSVSKDDIWLLIDTVSQRFKSSEASGWVSQSIASQDTVADEAPQRRTDEGMAVNGAHAPLKGDSSSVTASLACGDPHRSASAGITGVVSNADWRDASATPEGSTSFNVVAGSSSDAEDADVDAADNTGVDHLVLECDDGEVLFKWLSSASQEAVHASDYYDDLTASWDVDGLRSDLLIAHRAAAAAGSAHKAGTSRSCAIGSDGAEASAFAWLGGKAHRAQDIPKADEPANVSKAAEAAEVARAAEGVAIRRSSTRATGGAMPSSGDAVTASKEAILREAEVVWAADDAEAAIVAQAAEAARAARAERLAAAASDIIIHLPAGRGGSVLTPRQNTSLAALVTQALVTWHDFVELAQGDRLLRSLEQRDLYAGMALKGLPAQQQHDLLSWAEAHLVLSSLAKEGLFRNFAVKEPESWRSMCLLARVANDCGCADEGFYSLLADWQGLQRSLAAVEPTAHKLLRLLAGGPASRQPDSAQSKCQNRQTRLQSEQSWDEISAERIRVVRIRLRKKVRKHVLDWDSIAEVDRW
jgi:hypothetical protein